MHDVLLPNTGNCVVALWSQQRSWLAASGWLMPLVHADDSVLMPSLVHHKSPGRRYIEQTWPCKSIITFQSRDLCTLFYEETFRGQTWVLEIPDFILNPACRLSSEPWALNICPSEWKAAPCEQHNTSENQVSYTDFDAAWETVVIKVLLISSEVCSFTLKIIIQEDFWIADSSFWLDLFQKTELA